MKQCGIYLIRNKVNGKVYVGSSVDIQRRLTKHHFHLLRSGKHWNRHLQAAWNLHGEKNFEAEVVQITLPDRLTLIEQEQFWMDHYMSHDRNHGYNIVPTADRSIMSSETIEIMRLNGIKRGAPLPPGWHHSEESKKKISTALTGVQKKPFSSEHREKIGASHRGKTYEDIYGVEKANEIKKKQSMANMQRDYSSMRGQILSEEHRRKIAAGNVGRKHSETSKRLMSLKRTAVHSEKQIDAMRLMYDSGESVFAISLVVNLSEYLVRKFLKEDGLWKSSK